MVLGQQLKQFQMKKRMTLWKLSKLLKIIIFYWKELLKQSKNKTKEQKKELLGALLGTLGASLLGNMLAEKGIVREVMEIKKEKDYRS